MSGAVQKGGARKVRSTNRMAMKKAASEPSYSIIFGTGSENAEWGSDPLIKVDVLLSDLFEPSVPLLKGKTLVSRVPVFDIMRRAKAHHFVARKALDSGSKPHASGITLRQIGSVIKSQTGEREPIGDIELAQQARNIGLEPGKKVPRRSIDQAIKRVATTMTDLFPTIAKAEEYLRTKEFGSNESSGADMLTEGRVVSVLARIEELRFGSRG